MKKIFTLLVLMMMAPWVGWGQEKFSGGTGTEDDPYLISSSDDLKSLAESVNGGEFYIEKYFELTQDIDLKGNEENQWTPIGIYSSKESDRKPFCGIFDGKNNVISGLFINEDLNNNEAEIKDSFGLFGNISYNAKVKNLTVKGKITAAGIIGGICGYANLGCQIENCCSEVSIEGTGLKEQDYVEDELATPPTLNYNPPMLSIGGICGSISNLNARDDVGTSFIKKCHNRGTICVAFSNVAEYKYEEEELGTFLYNMACVGGIVGGSSSLVDILDSYNEGNITVKGENNVVAYTVGGVCGLNLSSSIENCYNIGDISTADLSISDAEGDEELASMGIEYSYIALGGVVGQQGATALDASNQYIYNKGSILSSSTEESNYVGSICGKNAYLKMSNIPDVSIQNAYYWEIDNLKAVGAEEGSDVSTIAKNNFAFESGEVAWLLHKDGGNFGQGLDEDGKYINDENKNPVLLAFNEGTEVYQLKLKVNDNDEEIIYRNSIESNLLSETEYNNLLDGAVDEDVVWKDEEGNVVVSGNRYTPTEDIALNATVENVHNIYTKIIPDGAGDIMVKGSAAAGETISFTVTTNEGYESVSVAGAAFTEGEEAGSYTFTMPAGDVTITATFKKIETGDDDDDEGGIGTKRYQLFLADQDFYLNDEYDAEGLVLYSLHDKRYTKAGSSFTIWFEKHGEVNEGARVFISNRANGEYKEVKLDEVSGYYQIRNVQSNIYVKLYTEEGFPVANESIEATDARAYAQANKIVVITPEPTDVQIISMAGAVVATAQVAGQQEFANLAEGVYIVRMGKEIVKLQVRN